MLDAISQNVKITICYLLSFTHNLEKKRDMRKNGVGT